MDDERSWRQARREFIRAHHPDRGGDPGTFAAGLARYDRLPSGPPQGPPPARVVVVADTPLLLSLVTVLLRRIGVRRPPPRVR